MKLHLPKLLLAAILVAVASPAYTKSYLVTDHTSSQDAFEHSTSDDTITFDMSSGYLHSANDSNKTLHGNAVITQLTIDDGFSGKEYIFEGKVSGSGAFTFTNGKSGNQTYTFKGSMAGYSGAMEINSNKIGTFNFNDTTIGSAEGAGSITATHDESKINLNNSTSYASITASNLAVTGACTVNGAVSATNLSLTDNSILNAGNQASITATNLIATGASTVNATVTVSGELDVSGISAAIEGTGTLRLGNAAINISREQYNNGNVAVFGSSLGVDGKDTAPISVDGFTLNNVHYTSTWIEGTLVSVSHDTVRWNGGTNETTWNTSDQNWAVGNDGTHFEQGDTVLFDSSASFSSLSGDIRVLDMTVSGTGTVVTLGKDPAETGKLMVRNRLVIENGAKLILGKETGTVGLVQGEVTVKEGGTLQFDSRDVTGYWGGNSSLHTLNVEKGGIVFQNTSSNETFAGTLNLEGTYNGRDVNSRFDLFESSARIVVGNDNADAAMNIHLQLRRDDAAISVGNNSTLTISNTIDVGALGNGAKANGILNKAGEGLLKATGHVAISGLNVNAGSVEFGGGGSVGNIVMGTTETSLSFNGDGMTYTAGQIGMTEQNSMTRAISVGNGATVNAAVLNNNWGMRSLTVNGTLNLVHATGADGNVTQAGELILSSGPPDPETERTTVGGTGTINAYALKVGNAGVYDISVHELNIGAGGWTETAAGKQTVYVQRGSTINLNGQAVGAKVTMEGGTLNINDTLHAHSFEMIDGSSSGGKGAGTVNFKANTTTNINELWGYSGKAEFLLENDAVVKLSSNKVTVTGQEGGSSLSCEEVNAQQGGAMYSSGNDKWVISQAAVAVDGVDRGELHNKLVSSSLINEGSSAVTATNTASTYRAIEAKGNDITIRTDEAGAIAQSLYVGEGKTVAFATANGTATQVTLSQSATIYGNVTGQVAWATESAGATHSLTLNTVYDAGNSILSTMASGSSINFMSQGQIVTLSGNLDDVSSLKLAATLTLNEAVAGSFLSTETRWLITGTGIYGQTGENSLVDFDASTVTESSGSSLTRYALATSLDAEWTLPEGTAAFIREATVPGAGAYRFVATNEGIGIQYYQNNVPEPTTATLSLLALAALAARRRRSASCGH